VPTSGQGRRFRTAAALAAAVAALVAGCSSGGDSSASDPASDPTPSGGDVHLARQSAPHPIEGDCHDLTAARVGRPNDTTETVPCRKPHTTQTYYVGTFDLKVIGDRTPSASEVATFVTPRCARRFTRWVGGDRQTRMLSRAHPVWFVPTARDIRLGARWFRCDVVLSGVGSRLERRLPRDTEGLLDSSDALDEYGLCSRGSPQRPRSVTVICGRRHSWQAFAALRVRTERAGYPPRKVLREARNRCRERAREELDFPLEWRYGWQPPTRRQWASGLEWGVCWVPRD
jgi:Septum formation